MISRVFKAFRYRDFRLMWIGSCTSSIGTWMQIVAQGWLIYRISHSPALLSLDQFLGGIPILLLSLVGGVVADRFERRRILLLSQYVQMASAGTLTVLVTTGLLGERVWPILCLSFVSGVAQAFGGPAYQALIPTLVEKEDMPNAIALNSIQFNLAVVLGPALAGITLARLGEKWCFGLNALSFLAPIISLSVITTRFLPKKTTESMYSSLIEGIRFVRKQASMEALIVLAFCMTALSAPMRAYFPVFVQDIYHGGPQTYGTLLTLMGLGSIGGSLMVAGAGHMGKRGRVALTAIFCLGAAAAGFSFSRSLPQGGAMLVLAGVSMMAAFASVSSLVQLITTDDMRGRVMSVYNVAFRGGMPMGNLFASALVRGVVAHAVVVRGITLFRPWHIPALPVPVVVRLDGMLLALVALYFLVIQRRVAEL